MTRLLLIPLVLLAACSAPTLDASVRYGLNSLDGDILTGTGGTVVANSFNDLGLNDDEPTPGATVDFKWGSPHLSISTQSSSFSGSGVLSSQLEIGGDIISVGADVDSNIDVGVTSAILTFDLAPTSALELGIGVGVVALDLNLRFREDLSGTTVESDEVIPIPVLAARAGMEFGDWEVGGVVSGLDIEVDGDSVQFVDLDVFGKYHFAGGQDRISASFLFGYRSTDLTVDYADSGDQVDANLTVAGPYIGLRFSF
jgi:hypothetical protein